MVESGMAQEEEGRETAKGNRIVGYFAIGCAVILGGFTAVVLATGGDIRPSAPVAAVGMLVVAGVAFYRAHRLGSGSRR